MFTLEDSQAYCLHNGLAHNCLSTNPFNVKKVYPFLPLCKTVIYWIKRPAFPLLLKVTAMEPDSFGAKLACFIVATVQLQSDFVEIIVRVSFPVFLNLKVIDNVVSSGILHKSKDSLSKLMIGFNTESIIVSSMLFPIKLLSGLT